MEEKFPDIAEIPGLLKTVTFMSLTTCADNRPWCSPVFYAYDDDLNFYWKSSPTAVHSVNIDKNPTSTIVIYNSALADREGFGLYFEGISSVITDIPEIERANTATYKCLGQEAHPIDWLLEENCPRKFYKLVPSRAWVNGVVNINNVLVDIRKEIPLSVIKEIIR